MAEELLKPAEMYEEAQAAYQRGEYQTAVSLFRAAAQGYRKAEEPLMAAEMSSNCSVALLMDGDAAGSLVEAEQAQAVFESAGDHKRMALALGNRAAALDALHRTDEALGAYNWCSEILKELQEHELRAYVMQAISKIYLRKGKPLEAVTVMRIGVNNLPHPSWRQRLLKNLLEVPFKMK
jgi:tetratricopeptide (TPR) repeat protein